MMGSGHASLPKSVETWPLQFHSLMKNEYNMEKQR